MTVPMWNKRTLIGNAPCVGRAPMPRRPPMETTPRLMCQRVTLHNGAYIGGEEEGKWGVGVPKGILGQHWGGGGGSWWHEQCTLKVFAWCLVCVSCSGPQFWAGRKFT